MRRLRRSPSSGVLAQYFSRMMAQSMCVAMLAGSSSKSVM